MNFLLSGYYGFGNAGDEAVLAAITQTISTLRPDARFVVTSGDPASTVNRFNSETTRVAAVPRQDFKALGGALRASDVVISGGGSLLQDITSLRNIVYYTGLMRMANYARKPVMVYAQGIGPLLRPWSRKLTRVAVSRARVVTVRDEDSKTLLQSIGVTRPIEVTADPVWALTPQPLAADGDEAVTDKKTWLLGLRPWPGYEYDPAISPQIAGGLRAAAEIGNARYRCVPMQDGVDRPIMEGIARAGLDVVHHTAKLHPREIMALSGRGDVMVAMRLHALIFAAAQRMPCVAVNYDPKVEALANIIGAPLLNDLSTGELDRLPQAVADSRPMDPERLANLQASARRNAELAVGLI